MKQRDKLKRQAIKNKLHTIMNAYRQARHRVISLNIKSKKNFWQEKFSIRGKYDGVMGN